MEPIRVIVTGGYHFRDYARLRDLLDRLPGVVILSRWGSTATSATCSAGASGRASPFASW